jgi:hypothetical protein
MAPMHNFAIRKKAAHDEQLPAGSSTTSLPFLCKRAI